MILYIVSYGLIVFIIVTMYLVISDKLHTNITKEIKERKKANFKIDKLTIIIGLFIYIMYSLIGYLFKIQILIPFEIRKDGGSINFLLPILWFVTTLIVLYVIVISKKIYKSKKLHKGSEKI